MFATLSIISTSADALKPDCTPYSLEACQQAAEELGLSFQDSSDDYSTKGCYAYAKSRDFDNVGKVWYGEGGSLQDMSRPVLWNKDGYKGYRPFGYDCKVAGKSILTLCAPISTQTLLSVQGDKSTQKNKCAGLNNGAGWKIRSAQLSMSIKLYNSMHFGACRPEYSRLSANNTRKF